MFENKRDVLQVGYHVIIMLMTLVAKKRMRESVAHITKIRGYYITIGGNALRAFNIITMCSSLK